MKRFSEGERVDRYRIDSVLSERGGEMVLAATEDETERAVAITVLEAPEAEPEALRTRAERAERAAGIARVRRVEPILVGRLEDGSAFVVNERDLALPLVVRSPAPIGMGFGSPGPSGEMSPDRAMLEMKSLRARRRAFSGLVRVGLRALIVLALALALAWLAFVR